ncbi:MAG: Holliday junction DNA helicase RuvB [Candidatus Lambdaproteobacteria bacterium RIFOXYD2_FULL_50_16]|uniref:Holliday junction branch migration complex subunit RuvB n=1 Tax=Candidatus Lambdaproteobacteria bacterium RIFOXYD2_FULL_50_16 TaxID=1817772 RepID=A0A1F6GEV2_9PROT|nr:MAG: Holliday junction DNA helicase RuvB [Candidatus Lambdaproteobacteria bacterium RIFOXYD2_FULL_50_16]
MEDPDKITTPSPLEEDQSQYSLRPRFFREYIGQVEMKENLQVFISSAKGRGQSLDHVLLHGPPGLGKTTMAHLIANEMGRPLKSTSGPVIEKQGDLAAILTSLEPGQVLFIDEIHRMSRVVEEVLYSAMEDFKLDIMIGQGPSARTLKLDLPPFTLVGATTRTGLLSSPLRERFGIPLHFGFYSPKELSQIITRSAGILETEIYDDAADQIGRRSRGTPRIANRLLKRARDFADHRSGGVITGQIVNETLERLGVDENGLDRLDRRIIEQIIEGYGGGPVGINTIAASVGEESDTIEDVVEPYLLQIGFLQRTPRGRVVTQKARLALGFAPSADQLGF